ncbi:MAG: hypothetical protein U1E65_35015 [Myxococcota bacterium]
MSTISIGGKRMNEDAAVALLKQYDIKPTKAHLERLAELTPDKDANNYLKKAELDKGAIALLHELKGGGNSGAATPDKPIQGVIDAAPLSQARYQISISDDHKTITFDPKQPKSLLMAKAAASKPKSKSVDVSHTFLGGVNVQIENQKGKLETFKDGRWVKKSFAEVAKSPDDLERLKAAGYNVHAKRDILVVNTKEDSSATFFATRDSKIDKDAPPPEGGPNVKLAKQDLTRGFVAICTETTIEWFGDRPAFTVKKPVIYLYPEKKTNVTVKVDVVGEFSAQYPKTKFGTWNMVAMPDGTLFDPKTEKKYGYLFWEAKNPSALTIDPAKAYCVKSDESERFLEDAALRFGLNDREKTDFVSFWIAALEQNPYSLVQFLTDDECAAYASMSVEPKPDTEIRLFMMFQRVNKPVKVGSPVMPEKKREKFTVVEWGGANLDE